MRGKADMCRPVVPDDPARTQKVLSRPNAEESSTRGNGRQATPAPVDTSKREPISLVSQQELKSDRPTIVNNRSIAQARTRSQIREHRPSPYAEHAGHTRRILDWRAHVRSSSCRVIQPPHPAGPGAVQLVDAA